MQNMYELGTRLLAVPRRSPQLGITRLRVPRAQRREQAEPVVGTSPPGSGGVVGTRPKGGDAYEPCGAANGTSAASGGDFCGNPARRSGGRAVRSKS
jgi:hypothetical protein